MESRVAHSYTLQEVVALCVYFRRLLHVGTSNDVHPIDHQVCASLTALTLRAQGFDTIPANALAAVGAALALVVVFIFAFISDKTNRRGATVISAQFCYLVTLIVARQVQPHVGRWSRWGLWTTVNAFAVGYHPVHNSWVQLNCRDPRERNISIA